MMTLSILKHLTVILDLVNSESLLHVIPVVFWDITMLFGIGYSYVKLTKLVKQFHPKRYEKICFSMKIYFWFEFLILCVFFTNFIIENLAQYIPMLLNQNVA
jgi:hypothetical protein